MKNPESLPSSLIENNKQKIENKLEGTDTEAFTEEESQENSLEKNQEENREKASEIMKNIKEIVKEEISKLNEKANLASLSGIVLLPSTLFAIYKMFDLIGKRGETAAMVGAAVGLAGTVISMRVANALEEKADQLKEIAKAGGETYSEDEERIWKKHVTDKISAENENS
jgi:Fe2+ transport system protein B